jgi:hypothetical protein
MGLGAAGTGARYGGHRAPHLPAAEHRHQERPGRLRAAGVSLEDRQDLLGHEAGRVTTHCSSAEVANLMKAANAVKKSRESPTRTVFRLISAEG